MTTHLLVREYCVPCEAYRFHEMDYCGRTVTCQSCADVTHVSYHYVKTTMEKEGVR